MADLMKYMSAETTKCAVAAADWEEAVRAAGQLLLEAGAIEESYIQRCVDTVQTEGPYMVLTKGIALAHTRPGADVHKEALSLVSLETPVEFGHKDNDPVKLVFLLAALTDNSHIGALMELAQKLSEEGVKETLPTITDSEQLYRFLIK